MNGNQRERENRPGGDGAMNATVAIAVTEPREPLSERESEILGLVARGYRDADIARLLFISLNTVKTHIKHILDRMEVSNRHAAAWVYWETNGPRGGKITRNE